MVSPPSNDEPREQDGFSIRQFLRAPSEVGSRWPLLALVFAVSLGALGGVGTYTFRYAEGLSYFKRDPKACTNCHIMQPEYDAWSMGSHHNVAVCVDCHLPHEFVPKYLAKAENGWRHGKLFTTGGFKEPIVVQEAGRKILQANCINCHGGITAEMNEGNMKHPGLAAWTHGAEVECIHCHSTVGHGQKAGLGGPMTAEELSHE